MLQEMLAINELATTVLSRDPIGKVPDKIGLLSRWIAINVHPAWQHNITTAKVELVWLTKSGQDPSNRTQ
jgi:hypothetical protein